MKVLFDISQLGLMHGKPVYGGGRFLEILATELAKSGECELFFSAAQSLKLLNRTLDYLGQHKEFSHVPLLRPRFPTQLYRSYHRWIQSLYTRPPFKLAGRFFRRLMSEGLKGINYFLSPFDPKATKNMDIFRAHIASLSPWMPRCNGQPKRIIHIDNLLPLLGPKPSSELDIDFNRRLLKKVRPEDWITSVSHTVKNDILSVADWIDPMRIRVIHLGASGAFRPASDQKEIDFIRTKFKIPEGPYLFSFNHISPSKNTLLAVQTFKALIQEEGLKDLSLVLAGYPYEPRGPLGVVLENSLEVKKRVIFTGFIFSDPDLASLYSGALAFIYPTLFEGFGLPQLEAMQCGAPVIASNRTAIPEVGGDAAVLIDPAHVDKFGEVVLKIYRNPEYRKKLIALSLAQAKKFSWEKCIRETLDTYKMALSHN